MRIKWCFFKKSACNFKETGYIKVISLRRDGRAVEGAALEMLFRRNPNASSNLALSAIFFASSEFFKSESVCAPIAKTRWHKGFYKSCHRVFETHSDCKVRPFSPDFRPSGVWILRISGAPEKLECFHNSFIISNNAFRNPTQPGGG